MALLTRRRVIPEHRHPVAPTLQRLYYPWVSALMRRRRLSIAIAVVAVLSAWPVYHRLGSEFHAAPPRGRHPLHAGPPCPTLSITEATRLLQIQDRILKWFPEVLTVRGTSQPRRDRHRPRPPGDVRPSSS